jgi:hypothetical protein
MKISLVVVWSSLKGLPHAVIFSPSILLSMIIYAATSIPNIVVSLPLPVLWDPGGTKFPIMFMTGTDVTKLQSTYVYSTKIVHVFAVDFRARGAPIFAYARTCYLAFDSRWTEAVLVLAVPCSKRKPVAKHEYGKPLFSAAAHAITMCSLNSCKYVAECCTHCFLVVQKFKADLTILYNTSICSFFLLLCDTNDHTQLICDTNDSISYLLVLLIFM